MEKILITGSDGRFGKILKRIKTKKKLIFKNKKELNIMSTTSIKNCLKKNKPKCILHLAGLSRPMNVHDKNIAKSIDLIQRNEVNLIENDSSKKTYFTFPTRQDVLEFKKNGKLFF